MRSRDSNRFVIAAVVVYLIYLIVVGIAVSGIVYVALHFIRKWW